MLFSAPFSLAISPFRFRARLIRFRIISPLLIFRHYFADAMPPPPRHSPLRHFRHAAFILIIISILHC